MTVDNDIGFIMTQREKGYVDMYGVAIEYFEYPHYKGFSVGLRHGGGGC